MYITTQNIIACMPLHSFLSLPFPQCVEDVHDTHNETELFCYCDGRHEYTVVKFDCTADSFFTELLYGATWTCCISCNENAKN